MTREYDIFVDAKGLKCPQPLLITKQAIKELETNQVLLLEATDPHTDLDLEVWCHRFEHEIIASFNKNNIFKFWIKKGTN